MDVTSSSGVGLQRPSHAMAVISDTEPSIKKETHSDDSSSSCEYFDSVIDLCEQVLLVEETAENQEQARKTEKPLSYGPSSSKTHDSNIEICDPGELDDEKTVENEQQVGKTKKRKRQPETWSKVKAKMARNAGKSYISASKSKRVFKERSLRPSCESNKCKFKCSSKIDDQKRLEIFQSYWGLKDLILQRDFISKSIEKVGGDKRRKVPGSSRGQNRAYYFNDGAKRIRVCKQMFTATLDISHRAIRTVISKQEEGSLGEDLRGRHKKHARLSSEIISGVKQHIDSHYLQQETAWEYINGDRSLTDLYRHYKNYCEDKGLPPASMTMYSRIFNCEYDSSFYLKKEDLSESE